jgi:hypothetical protein
MTLDAIALVGLVVLCVLYDRYVGAGGASHPPATNVIRRPRVRPIARRNGPHRNVIRLVPRLAAGDATARPHTTPRTRADCTTSLVQAAPSARSPLRIP